MAGYNETVNRTDAGALVPVEHAKEIIQEAPKDSAALSLMRRVPMSSKTKSQPVLSVLPQAYWVNGDSGLKQTTKQQWKNQIITAEELAAIVVIPDALFDDAEVPLWEEVKPYLRQAIGQTVDAAVLFGNDKPASWTTPAVVPGAVNAGNTVALGTGADIGVDIAALGEKVALDGYTVNGFASRPGLQWSLRMVRSADGIPIYGSTIGDNGGPGLYGFPLREIDNGAWDADEATLVAADWSKFVIGIRQDITFEVFKEGVISDADGKVIVNLMQQDSKALRVVFRVGYVGANPITALNSDDGTRFPAGVLTPSGSASPVEPVLTSVAPTTGAAGDTITLTGTGFTDATQVRFGSANATSFAVVSDTQITAVVPAGTAGSAAVRVIKGQLDSDSVAFTRS
ncbi:MAG: hypothetical protein BGN97_00260 [Microbacterium sp. 69-10]|nr:MAG: hypothetical protein BGN97_00260 [Microbacterium sp. 69-10]